jgi:hypothetical protein
MPAKTVPNSKALALAREYIEENEPCDLSWEEEGDATEWFGGNEQANQHLEVFASRGDGSLLALWKRNGVDKEAAPVVLLGGEGELAVLGGSVPEALATLAAIGTLDFMIWVNVTDDDEEAIAPPDEDEEEDEDDAFELEPDEEFADWVEETFGRRVEDPGEAMRAAMKKHPGFVKFARGLAA